MALAYCDTSFLWSVYGRDAFTSQALGEFQRAAAPFPVSVLNEYELENGVRLALFRKQITPVDARIILADFAADMSAGKLIRVSCDLDSVFVEARRLSAAHTIAGGHRQFDILHVAAAAQIGARDFLSFDANQRKLAKSARCASCRISAGRSRS